MSGALAAVLIAAGLLLVVAGLVGCVIPVLPGPIFAYLGLIVLSLAKNWTPFSATFLIVTGILTAVVTALDYVVPALGAKKFGASKWGVWMSVVGLFVGLFVFPPFGIFIGAFAGGVAGELYAGRDGKSALKAGWGVFLGNMAGIGLKLAFCGFALIMYLKGMF